MYSTVRGSTYFSDDFYWLHSNTSISKKYWLNHKFYVMADS